MSDLSGILLKENDILFRALPDYFKKNNEEDKNGKSKFNMDAVASSNICSVGIIERVGKNIENHFGKDLVSNEDLVGRLVFLEEHVSRKVKIKSLGEYEIVAIDFVLYIRKNN